MIVGNEYKDTWIQYLGKKKCTFKNPIHQNYGHIKSLEEILQLNNSIFISIICFLNQTKVKVNNQKNITQLVHLEKLIKSSNKIILEQDINLIANKIISLNITNKKERKNHVKKIKEQIK